MNNKIFLIEISKEETQKFDEFIKKYRDKYIRNSSQVIDDILLKDKNLDNIFQAKEISNYILLLRELVWQEYLKDEISFNAYIMRDLYKILNTPKEILDILVSPEILNIKKDKLLEKIKEICWEYAWRVFPYIYRLSLSNTQSRRSRSWKTFEAIIYKIYEKLNYKYDSQNKVWRKIFDSLWLWKKVDSILPDIESFRKRRNKTIIGTMKTSLRERWQEVAEEIERTKIPEIHLLTVDDNIPKSKAMEMSNHNIIVVTFDWVANSQPLMEMKNIISFEEYLFEEIPSILNFWNNEK